MSITQASKLVTLHRVVNPSPQELDDIVQVLIKGFENETYLHHSPISASTLQLMKAEDFHRARHMCWLGPALIDGQLWVARSAPDNVIVAVGVWTLPGRTLGDTPEQRKYGEEFNKLISPQEAAFEAEFKHTIVNERNALFPGLWRKTFHLHCLVTLPDARGKGIGSVVMEELAKQSRERGEATSLATATEAAKRFYERHNFKAVWKRDVAYPNGETADYIVMTKDA